MFTTEGKKVESIEVAYCLKIDKNTTGDELNKLAKKMYKEIFEVTEGVEIWDYNTIVRVFDDIRNGNV